MWTDRYRGKPGFFGWLVLRWDMFVMRSYKRAVRWRNYDIAKNGWPPMVEPWPPPPQPPPPPMRRSQP